jgi:hypothetical protein
MSEDVLAGLPSLGQPCVRCLDGILPRRDLARATFVGFSSDLPGDTGLTGDPYRSDRYSVEALQGAPLRACWPRKCANNM